MLGNGQKASKTMVVIPSCTQHARIFTLIPSESVVPTTFESMDVTYVRTYTSCVGVSASWEGQCTCCAEASRVGRSQPSTGEMVESHR